MRTLNKYLPFGEVHGGGAACYEQDGALFNSEGKEIGARDELVTVSPDSEPQTPVGTAQAKRGRPRKVLLP